MEKTKLTLEIGEVTTSWEVPYADVGTYEVIEAFIGMLVTHTFPLKGIKEQLKTYIEEHEN